MNTETLNTKYAKAARVLSHKGGASVAQVAKAIGGEARQARLVIDRLRNNHGLKIKNVSRGVFEIAARKRKAA